MLSNLLPNIQQNTFFSRTLAIYFCKRENSLGMSIIWNLTRSSYKENISYARASVYITLKTKIIYMHTHTQVCVFVYTHTYTLNLRLQNSMFQSGNGTNLGIIPIEWHCTVHITFIYASSTYSWNTTYVQHPSIRLPSLSEHPKHWSYLTYLTLQEKLRRFIYFHVQ